MRPGCDRGNRVERSFPVQPHSGRQPLIVPQNGEREPRGGAGARAKVARAEIGGIPDEGFRGETLSEGFAEFAAGLFLQQAMGPR